MVELTNPSGWYGIVIGLSGLIWQATNAFLDRRRKILIRQGGSEIENCVFSSVEGRVFYQIRVSITNDSPRRPVIIRRYELCPPWKDDGLDLLDDPDDGIPSSTEYVIQPPFLRYPRELILNHRVNSQGELAVGGTISGMLIFRGVEPIPADLVHGSPVPVTVKVFLQDERCYSETCLLRVDKIEATRLPPSGTDLLTARH